MKRERVRNRYVMDKASNIIEGGILIYHFFYNKTSVFYRKMK